MNPVEIPHWFDPVPNSVGVDGKRLRQSATTVDPVSKVLGTDDLLIEILLLIGYPTTLIYAALVCKRWFCHASDPAFLCRFGKLHPPGLLGVYFKTRANRSRFVPMLPQPPENDAVISCASSGLDAHKLMLDDWNDIIFTKTFNNCDEEPRSIHIVRNPLCPARGMVTVPPFPCYGHQYGNFYKFCKLLFEEEGDGLSYFCVQSELSNDGRKSTVYVYMLQDGVWCLHTSPTTQLPCRPQILNSLLVDNKIYMAATQTEILVLDLTTSSFSTFQVPQGLVIGYKRTMLSRAYDNSGVYLIHLNGLQLCIWLRTGDNWLLVDTICLREMYAKLRMPDLTDWVWINQVGVNAEFVFLKMGQCLVYVGIKCRKLCKVYEMTSEDRWLGRIHPCMMIWPPTFHAFKDGPASDAM
ncbi:hypothetical protein ACQJBY_038392 [Aegilops geniculata]